MKLTKENYELMMFDLLEGNLSEAEEQALLNEIEQDPFFAKEWKLFSETVLEPETAVFAGKDALLKDEATAVIVPIRTRWQIFSYAAAVAAVFIGVFWFAQRAPQDNGVVEGTSNPDSNFELATQLPTKKQQPNPAEKVEEAVVNKVEAREEDIIPESVINNQEVNPSPILAIQGTDKTKKATDNAANKEQKSTNDSKAPESEKNNPMIDKEPLNRNIPEPKIYQPREVLVNLTPKTLPQNWNNTAKGNEEIELTEPILKSNPELDALVPVMAYTGMRSFLRRSATRLISPFRNPKIKVQKVEDENKPALNISFSSDAYYASAIVHWR